MLLLGSQICALTRVFQENKARQIFVYVCVSGGKKCSFFGKFGELSFLETPVLRFTLLSY